MVKMRILWIVNTIFPYPAQKIGMNKSCFGGWLNGLAENIIKTEDIKLTIATIYNGKKVQKLSDGKIDYYLIPGAPALKYNEKLELYWKKINNIIKPDIVHIHGTEYAHGLAFIKACPDKKIITSIQGLVHKIAEVYTSNISTKEIIKNITFRDFIKQDNIFQQKKGYEKRGRNEIEIIKNSYAIIGRTIWDYANVKAIDPKTRYYLGNEILRSSFYSKRWNINQIDRYTLFCSQASYPIKGFHYLVQAIYILKYKYPQIKLYVGGTNILDDSTLKLKIKKTGYAKYIENLIRKYNLQNNIIFTGVLSEKEILKKLLKTHVFVLPSTIENSSNSLAEAMLLGMPCVASNTGGTMDILKHEKEGYLYPYTEPAICAEYISRLFEEDELAMRYGEQAQVAAIERHNPENNAKEILKIYEELIGEK